jgi:Ser/Thr protein kinase RdoA (MazF antagonist)
MHFDDRVLVAKRMPDAAAARRLHGITQSIAERCRHVAPAQLLEGNDGGAMWLCTPYLEGCTWYETGGSQEQFAAALANLHAAMKRLPPEPIVDAMREREARVLGWLAREQQSGEVRRLAAANGISAAKMRELLEGYLGQAAQPIHHDLHLGNIWWSGGNIWFLDLEEVASSYLPVLGDVMRYAERHLLVPGRPERDFEELWRGYARESGGTAASSSEAFAAAAWNWLDSWAALQGLDPATTDYASEKDKFLAILAWHGRHWKDVARRIDHMAKASG